MADVSQIKLARAIDTLSGDGFEAALFDWLASVCPLDNATMIAFFEDRGPEVFFSKAEERRVFAQLESDYLRGAYLLDPVYALHTEAAGEGLYRLLDIAPDQFTRNEYFANYYRRTTLIDELIFLSHPAPGVSVTICVGRDASSRRKFSARARAMMQDVAPIVVSLANRHWGNLRSERGQDDSQVAEGLRATLASCRDISLSPRQAEIALLILRGHSSTSIGLNLGISPQTVKVIRKQLYRKCQISSQAELFSLLSPYLLGI